MDNFLNLFYYHWKRSNWIISPHTFTARFRDKSLNRPIFFVGNQGGGLTLISRMIRRHPDVVSITGNHNYWSGADEMQRVMVTRLPQTLRLSGKVLDSDPQHPIFTPPRSWSYGSDDLVGKYHLTEADPDSSDRKKLKKIIWEALCRFSKRPAEARFVDKSQVFTLKTRYLQKLLEGSDPHFVLISRDPVAACYRAASGKAGDMKRYAKYMSFNERLEICIQHWYNCMSMVMEDSKHLKHFRHYRFEDFLNHPEKSVKDLCDFSGLTYSDDLIPQAHHNIPFGTRYSKRWYPLNKDVNKKYIQEISDTDKRKILSKCKSLALELGYKY